MTIKCAFTGGNLQSKEPVPATYTTDNPIIQGVLEDTPMFLGGKVFVISQSEDATVEEIVVETPKPTTKKTTKKTKTETRTMENVRTFGDAMTVLMTEAEVNMSELTDIEACIKKAAELGISFPNLNK